LSPTVSILRTALRSNSPGNSAAWQAVRDALLDIATVLKDWAWQLGKAAEVPHIRTVRDIAETLDDFHQAQDQLIQWLSPGPTQRWTTLRNILNSSHYKQLWRKARSSISIFKIELEDLQRKNVQKRSHSSVKLQMQAGDDLRDFANTLRAAVEQAEQQRS
jgi:hypothetical protein